ncbi:unannotated protein [freshwater metagenome]|uniref:Unannotated protein n=1 Tax=freshwater metagenome TaxID=449393 RepID=A0A6J6KAP5_9ZZZZ
MPPVRSADANIEMMPNKNPKDAPKTRALKINMNHIGSIPTAPAPSGRRAAIIADRIPSKAIDFASNRELETSTITSTTASAIALQKISWV